MSFLNSDDGDFLPYMQWGSDAVTWFKKGDDGKEAFQPSKAVFDMENLQIGWIAIQIGSVDKVLVPYKDTPPARPEGTKTNQQGKDVPLYDKGFAVNVLFGKEFGEERLFEFSTSQKGSLRAMDALLTEYEAGKDANAGKAPLVEFGPHTHISVGKGSTNVPGLKIVEWVDRPAELDVNSPAVEPATPAATAATTGVSEF